ncbi:hypothetical protein A7E78_06895 [Syntrophotalea acetylenivorans]|uniref:Response regulatory domain-containing protein n=1 Tax=Syntrophotalea acetylenivorans TaxID=1842532 RepID=A0A1L3GNX7_9BACT|nr:response regulator [Syntrophotalea acetylenivorans]APG27585.1 hypothetical protein A7E78_06895 [Syntrophotalea acetylenivorans]
MKKKAVVVDDDDYCRYSLSSFLRKNGYEVTCFDSGIYCELHKGSQSMCSKEEPCGHFFLTDNRMPGIDGLMLIARQNNGACKVPIEMKAVLSGAFTTDELAQAEKLGCKIFQKPYDFDEISKWLDQQEEIIPPD